MLRFLRKPGPRKPSADILRALEAGGLPVGTDISTLGMVERAGRYSGRKVTYFRIYDSTRADSHAAAVFTNDDLGGHHDLVLRDGHVEADGMVVMNRDRHIGAASRGGSRPAADVPTQG